MGAPLHVPAVHLSPIVHKSPSSQVRPFCVVNAVVLLVGAQTSQGLAGFTKPAGTHWPLILHKP